MIDEEGNLPIWANWLIGCSLIVAACALTVFTAGLGGAIAGAMGGGFIASVAGGAIAGAAVGSVSGALISAGTQTIQNGFENINGFEVLKSAGTGALAGFVAGGIFGGINFGLSEVKIASSLSNISSAEKNLSNSLNALGSIGKYNSMPFSGRNIANAMGNAFKAYNLAYNNYITSKVTYDIAYAGAKAVYFIGENLFADLFGLIM